MAKLFGELLLNDEGTRVGGLGPISHRVIYTTDNIFEGKEKEKILFLERILKKLSIQLIHIYIKRNKQVVTAVSSSLPLHDFKATIRTISRDLSRHVSGCFQLSGIIFSPEGIERAGLKRNESPAIHPSPSYPTRARGAESFLSGGGGDTIVPTTFEIAAGTKLFPFVTRIDVIRSNGE